MQLDATFVNAPAIGWMNVPTTNLVPNPELVGYLDSNGNTLAFTDRKLNGVWQVRVEKPCAAIVFVLMA